MIEKTNVFNVPELMEPVVSHAMPYLLSTYLYYYTIYIKWMAMTSAVGNMSPVVLIVAINMLEDDNFIHYKVSGLASNNAIHLYIGECVICYCPRIQEQRRQ
jgi:hypothetical protein